MRVMVLATSSPAAETRQPEGGDFEPMVRYTEELIAAGVLLDSGRLQPSAKGARVRFDGSSRTVVDGPFTEAKELVAGYWLLQVKSLAEAVEWVKRCPNPHHDDSDIEIRPFFEPEDFA